MRVEEYTQFAGQVQFIGTANPTLGTETVGDDQVKTGAGVQASKLQHQHAIHYFQKLGTVVAAESQIIHIARGVGNVLAVEFTIETPPTGGTEKVIVDVQKSRAGGAPASILTAAAEFPTGTTARTIVVGSLGSTADLALVDGDILYIVVTISGTGGTQGKGLGVTITVREAA
jgi:hypothetical protein